MNDRLDEAIDRVAARLTSVDDDPALASRIIAALPERTTWFGWLLDSWALRLATFVLIVAAGALWNRREGVVIPAPLQSVARVESLGAPLVVAAKPEPARTNPLEPLAPLEPLETASLDHEKSLPSIAAVASLAIDLLIPASLPEDAPLTLEPLAIADLPLTAEPISPR